jgi:hypothetical protein
MQYLARLGLPATYLDQADGFAKCGELVGQATLPVECKRSAVEHQFILPTDQVGINDRHAGGADAVAQHLIAPFLLVHVKWRGIERQQDFGAGTPGRLGSTALPYIGTDIDPATDTGDLHHAGFMPGIEVAFFVKHLVIGQPVLAIRGLDTSLPQQRCCIEVTTVIAQGMADDQRQRCFACQLCQGCLTGPIEIRAQQQILGRIAAQCQLGGEQHVSSQLQRLAGGIEDAPGIALNVTDSDVDLGDCYAKCLHKSGTIPRLGRWEIRLECRPMARPDPAEQALLRLELRRYTTRCDSQERMIERADSLREVVRLASLSIPSSLYSEMPARDAQRKVLQAAENRAKTLIKEHIDAWLKAEPEFREKYRARMDDEWTSLTGVLGHLRPWAVRQLTTADQNQMLPDT